MQLSKLAGAPVVQSVVGASIADAALCRQTSNTPLCFLLIAPPAPPAVEVMGFSGAAPEIVNGRLAQLGFLAAVGAELATQQPVSAQLSGYGVPIAATFALFAVASLIPIFKVRSPWAGRRRAVVTCVVFLVGRHIYPAAPTCVIYCWLSATLIPPPPGCCLSAGRQERGVVWPFHPQRRAQQRPLGHDRLCLPADRGGGQGLCPVLSALPGIAVAASIQLSEPPHRMPSA